MRAKKVDGNHAEIVRVLKASGCGVLDLSGVGKGCPDLLVHPPNWPACRFAILLEIKDSSMRPSARKLTPQQERFHSEWKGWISVVTTPDEALAALGMAARSHVT